MIKRCVNTFLYAVMGGICIGLGGTAFLCTDSKIIGAVLFTVGLFTICTMGFNLFTGKVAYALENKPDYIIDLIFVWLGNFVGVALMAFLMSFTRAGEAMQTKALSICETKLNDSLLSMFILAIFCNLLIYIAVDGFKNNPHIAGKYVGLFLGVVGFIYCGFEHSIADMFYFSVANLWSLESLICILIVTAGNIVGGLLVPTFKIINKKLNDKK